MVETSDFRDRYDVAITGTSDEITLDEVERIMI
jgi:hypothetical protein